MRFRQLAIAIVQVRADLSLEVALQPALDGGARGARGVEGRTQFGYKVIF